MTIRAGENLKALLARIKRATQPHGRQAELAEFLKVSPQQLNNWLSGFRAPNGEATLRLLAWITAEEAKQTKAPGRATNTAKGKTRITKSYETKNDTSPPERYGGNEQATRKKRESRNHSTRRKA